MKICMVLLLVLICNSLCASSDLYWFDRDNRIDLYKDGYSIKYSSPIYSESAQMSSKQILTGNIILIFKNHDDVTRLDLLLQTYGASVIKKMELEFPTYIVKVSGNNESSLDIANKIYKLENVLAAYPDWQYINYLSK